MVLVEGRFIEIEVPIEFVGESQGAKKGGIIQFLLDTLTIKVLPDSIPEKIVIDVSSLDIGDSLHIEDLTKIDSFKNVVFVDKLDTPIVTVSKPEESEGQE
jgi:large subunit ribosomal protein L25